MDEERESAIAIFIKALATDRNTAMALVSEGYTSIEEVAYVPHDELLSVPGLDKAQVPVLRERARAYLLRGVLGEE